MTQPKPAARDLRIDFLRGFFILGLCGSHFSWLADVAGFKSHFRFYDMQPFGFSSPAEFFVFFSGYVLALVLGRGYDKIGYLLTQARTLDRSLSLYILNVFTFAIIVGCAAFLFPTSPALVKITHIDQLRAEPFDFILGSLSFRNNLTFFEILRNYIFFIPLIAPFIALTRVSRWLPLAISFTTWGLFQLKLIPGPQYGNFNPYAWQLIFFLGASAAILKPLTSWTFPHRMRQVIICALLLVLCCIAKFTLFPGIPAENVPWASKPGIGPLRLLHFGLSLWTVMLILPESETLGRSRIVRMVVAVGQNSLECFCLSNGLIYLGVHLLSLNPHSALRYWLLLTAIVLIMLGCAHLFGWFKSSPWAAKARSAPTNGPIADVAAAAGA